MSRKREITIFLKLSSVPALVVMSAIGDTWEILSRLTATGHKVRRTDANTIVVEE